jgi:ferrous iron transport protein B
MLQYDSRIKAMELSFTTKLEKQSPGYEQILNEKNEEVSRLIAEKESFRQENSMIGRIGKFIEPVMSPLGFDWRMSVSLLAGVAAKEVVVSTMSVLYQESADVNAGGESLQAKLQAAKFTEGGKAGQLIFTPVTAFAYLMFILLYFPCIAVVAAVRRESSKWKWAVFMVSYTTAVAWVVGLLVSQVGALV